MVHYGYYLGYSTQRIAYTVHIGVVPTVFESDVVAGDVEVVDVTACVTDGLGVESMGDIVEGLGLVRVGGAVLEEDAEVSCRGVVSGTDVTLLTDAVEPEISDSKPSSDKKD